MYVCVMDERDVDSDYFNQMRHSSLCGLLEPVTMHFSKYECLYVYMYKFFHACMNVYACMHAGAHACEFFIFQFYASVFVFIMFEPVFVSALLICLYFSVP
jgi:hypothetical protein